jgi:hypothetical protein
MVSATDPTELAHAPQHLRAETDIGHIACGADRELRPAHIDDTAARFAVRRLDRGAYLGLRDIVGAKLVRIDDQLILFHDTVCRGDFRNTLDRLQLIFSETSAATSGTRQDHGCRFGRSAHIGRSSQRRWHRGQAGAIPLRQAGGDLAEIFQHTGARPVKIHAVTEQDINVAVARELENAYIAGPRHREHGGGQRIGDLILHDLRRLSRIGRAKVSVISTPGISDAGSSPSARAN